MSIAIEALKPPSETALLHRAILHIASDLDIDRRTLGKLSERLEELLKSYDLNRTLQVQEMHKIIQDLVSTAPRAPMVIRGSYEDGERAQRDFPRGNSGGMDGQ